MVEPTKEGWHRVVIVGNPARNDKSSYYPHLLIWKPEHKNHVAHLLNFYPIPEEQWKSFNVKLRY